MKKLLFTLLLAAVTLPGWAGTKYPDVMYAIGTATSTDWNFNTSSPKLYKTSDRIYQGFVDFDTADGTLKFMTALEWNKGQWGALSNGQEITTNSGNRTTYADDAVGDTDADKKFVFKLPIGLYLVTIDATTEGNETITFTKWETNSVYEIGNLGQLKFFADRLNTDGVSLNAKLTADIGSAEGDKMDYAIGWHNGDEKSTNHKWYNGEFDGNYHTIYLNIDKRSDDNPNNQGLFGAITGGAYIHDVTVAGSVKGKSYVAGIVGSVRCNSGGGGTVNIFNCKNTAEITGSDGGTNTGGIVGVTMNYNGYCTTNISYCCNTGNVYGKSDSGLISGWIGNGSIKHTFASGTLQGAQGGNDKREFSRYQTCDFYANVTMTGSTETGGAYYFNPSDATYTISDADKFLAIATMVNVGGLTSKNFTLSNDIDLNGKVFTPIGNDNYKYAGTFDGGTHRIKNLKIDNDKKEQGLFSVCNGATIKNLIMDASCTIKSTEVTNAAFVAVCNGSGTLTFENCGNEAKVIGSKNNNAAFLAFNWVAGSNLTVSFRNCYNIGKVSGGWDNCAFIGWNSSSTVTFDNCWNIGTIENVNGDGNNWARSGSDKTLTNCYSTNSIYKFDGALKEVTDAQVADGTLCAKVGYGFRQNIGEGGDAHPNFVKTHGFVVQIGEAGYTTMYNIHSDVTIPSGIEAYAGVVNGENLSLVAIENKIAASEPVILKLAEGTDAGLFNFMPTTGATPAASNSLSGSDGSATGGANIYALANLIPEDETEPVVGFYQVNNGVVIPEGKAYLEYTGSNTVKGFTFVFDDEDPTGIEGVQEVQEVQGAIYNLAGQRIGKMQRGINIVNGKKIMVK